MQDNEPPVDRPDPGRQNITFITLLRAIASLLVVWCHLVSGWTIHHQVSFFPLAISRPWLTQPLAVIEDFGFLGVAIFFYVSGFIITHVAQRETQFAFLIKRVFRIYPPLILAVIVVGLLVHLSPNPLDQSGDLTARTLGDYLRGMTLLNYFALDSRYVNGVAWTLVIEVLFYTLSLLVLPLMRWSAQAVTLLLASLCWIIVFRSHDLGARFSNFSVSMGLVPLLLIGQSTYWLWIGRIKAWQFAILMAGNWFVFSCALSWIYVDMLPANNSYGVSALYAYLIFIIALLSNNHLRLPRILTFFATISYSLYLLHVPIGETLLSLLAPKIGYRYAIVPVFGIVTLASYLSWRFVELPTQNAARGLLSRFKPVSGSPNLNRGYAFTAAVIVVALGATLVLIHPDKRIPLATFLMPMPALPVPQATAAAASIAPADTFEGSFDALDGNTLTGWAWNAGQPLAAVSVDVFIDGVLSTSASADKLRKDLVTAGKGDGHHGFCIQGLALPLDRKSHSISIKVHASEKELFGSPKRVGNE